MRKAVREKIHRLDLIAERMGQMITDGTLMIDVDELLSDRSMDWLYTILVYSASTSQRITAKTFLEDGCHSISRGNQQLSGRIHDKGILIYYQGTLGWKYAQDRPLSLSASVCFEQSYSGVEGDVPLQTNSMQFCQSLGPPIRQDIA